VASHALADLKAEGVSLETLFARVTS